MTTPVFFGRKTRPGTVRGQFADLTPDPPDPGRQDGVDRGSLHL